jgi:hypothetical protein
MLLFLDGPALLACHARSGASRAILRQVRQEEGIAFSALADLELVELLLRLHGSGAPMEATQAILERYQRDANDFLRIPTDPLIQEAALLMARHGLEALPAQHLAEGLPTGP